MCCAVVWWSEMFSCSGSVMAGAVGVVLPARCWWILPLCLWMHCYKVPSHGDRKPGNNAKLWNRNFQALESYENFFRLWMYFCLVVLSFRIEQDGASCHRDDLLLGLACVCFHCQRFCILVSDAQFKTFKSSSYHVSFIFIFFNYHSCYKWAWWAWNYTILRNIGLKFLFVHFCMLANLKTFFFLIHNYLVKLVCSHFWTLEICTDQALKQF